MVDLKKYRTYMVEHHLKPRAIHDEAVLAAMGKVRREDFIPKKLRDMAYDDRPLPIAEGQTISQPFIVAFMTQNLKLMATDKVLEIGTGSGYAAAILGEVAGEVFTIERHKKLAAEAAKILKPWKNVHVVQGDGTKGLEKEAPFDAIVSTAAGPDVPQSWKKQLKDGGRLVMPVGGDRMFQRLIRLTRKGNEFEQDDLGGVAFVPLIGAEGF